VTITYRFLRVCTYLFFIQVASFGAMAESTLSSDLSFDLSVGRLFPSLVLPNLKGAPTSLADFRGRKVVLHIWASW
jgi:hypothetical protein